MITLPYFLLIHLFAPLLVPVMVRQLSWNRSEVYNLKNARHDQGNQLSFRYFNSSSVRGKSFSSLGFTRSFTLNDNSY